MSLLNDEQMTIHASQENAPESLTTMTNTADIAHSAEADLADGGLDPLMNADGVHAAAELAGDLDRSDEFPDAQSPNWSLEPQASGVDSQIAHVDGIMSMDPDDVIDVEDSQITEPGVIADNLDSQITENQITEPGVIADLDSQIDAENQITDGTVTRPGCVPTRAETIAACQGELSHIKLVCGAWLQNIELNRYTEKCLQDAEKLAYDASVLSSKLDEAIDGSTDLEINSDELLDSVAQLLRVYQDIRPTAYSCMHC